MTRWVALLRGVNVGGITVRSAELRVLFADLGLGGVRTVLASGNVAFDSDAEASTLRPLIERGLGERFGYEAFIVLEPQLRLAAVAAAFPFERDDANRHPYVVFASAASALDALHAGAADLDESRERIAPGDGVLYWQVERGGSTDTPFAKLLAKARFKATTTNRNLRTVEKLLDA